MKANEEKLKISILMPAFNAELYIKKAIESIFDQGLDNIEIIVVDDGSTDKTKDKHRHPKFKDEINMELKGCAAEQGR